MRKRKSNLLKQPASTRGSQSRHRSDEAGAAAVEFAVLLPLIVLVFAACGDFSRSLHAYHVISNAARTGAEYGSYHQMASRNRADWEAMICEVVHEEIDGTSGLESEQATIEIDTESEPNGLYRVSVRVNYTFETIVRWPLLPTDVEISPRVAMRQVR